MVGLGSLGILISVVVIVVALLLACIRRMDPATAACLIALAVVNLL